MSSLAKLSHLQNLLYNIALMTDNQKMLLHICQYKKMFVILRTTKKEMENKGYTLEQEQIARFAKAMGHPARIAILEFLARQNCCFFGDIHEELPIAKATVSQHLKELKEAGLIQGEIETPKVKYCINRENWKIASMLFSQFFGQCVCKKENCCE